MNGFSLSPAQMGLAVALGCGLLIGLERERRKGLGQDRAAAGLRTFAVAALLGAIAQIVSVWLAAVALLSVAAMAALSYWRSRDDDPGITTELSLIATTLIGMMAVPEPVLSAACAALLAGVLAARDRLHHVRPRAHATEHRLPPVPIRRAVRQQKHELRRPRVGPVRHHGNHPVGMAQPIERLIENRISRPAAPTSPHRVQAALQRQ